MKEPRSGAQTKAGYITADKSQSKVLIRTLAAEVCGRSREASQNAPSNSSHESTTWINSRCPSWKTLALSCLHVGSLARQTRQLIIGTVMEKTSRPKPIADLF